MHRRFVAIIVGLFLFSAPVFAQTVVYRIDPAPVMTSASVSAGGFPTAFLVPNATIKLCTNSTCTALATAYTDATGFTACPTSAPVTLPGTSVCTPTAGSQGQFGFWIQPGTYYYTVTTITGTFGPYPISSPTLGILGGPGIVSSNTVGGLVPMTSNLDCSAFTGASASLKLTACANGLPSTGGTLDARNIQGAQTWNTDAFSGITKSIDLTCQGTTFTVSTNSTIPANVHLIAGQDCLFSVNSGVTLTINGGLDPSLTQHFSGSGTVAIASPQIPEVYPQWWGALGNGSNDDTAAIQASINSIRGTLVSTAYGATARLVLPPGTYKTTSQLNAFNAGVGTYENFSILGSGMDVTNISYSGSAGSSAIQSMGGFTRIANLAITDAGSGWVSGYSYDAKSDTGRSTHGRIENVYINCNSQSGDGIDLGLDGFQADMLDVDHVYIAGCPSGNGIATFNGNVLSINVFAPTITGIHVAVNVGTGTNLNVFGGEIDNNDVNFESGGGGPFIVDGVRSEGSKRSFWTGSAVIEQPFTLRNYTLSSINTSRPTTTGAITSGFTALTLSTPGFVSGDSVTIAGAGTAGSTLHATITSMSSLTAATITPAASTTVTVGAIALDGSVQQNNLVEAGGGPYRLEQSIFLPASGTTVSVANGPQTFIGNIWEANVITPFGPYVAAGTNNATEIDNWYNFSSSPTRMPNQLRTELASTLTANSATPSVFGVGPVVITANTNPTTITRFANPTNGQLLRVIVNDANTTFSASDNIRLPGGSPVTATSGGIYEFVYNNAWFPIVSTALPSPAVSFANLPGCTAATEGLIRAISDSSTTTWGAAIGFGSSHVLAYCNGTAWTVAAK